MQDWEFLKPIIRLAVSKFKDKTYTYEQIHEPRVKIIYLVVSELIEKQTDPHYIGGQQELYRFARDQMCNIFDKEPSHLARFIWIVRELAKNPAFNLYAHEKAF